MKKTLILFFLLFSLFSCSTEKIKTSHQMQALTENNKICIFGDSGKNNQGQLLVANALKKEKCTHILHTGDIIYSRGLENKNDPKFKTHFHDYYKDILETNIPFYLSVGNHDYKKNPDVWIHHAKESNSLIFPNSYYFSKMGNLCLITIDTNAKLFEQYLWFQKIKKQYKDQCHFTIAMGHHPLYSSGHHGDAHILNQFFLKSTIHSSVDLYVSGHDHNLSDEGEIEGTRYLVSGAGAVTRPLKKIRHKAIEKIGYLVLHYQKNKKRMNYYFVSIDKKRIFSQRNTIIGKGFQ